MVAPAATADAIVSSNASRDCAVVPGAVRACNVILRHVINAGPCDATGCDVQHECILELTGYLAKASGMCGGQPWALSTPSSLVSTYRDDGTLFVAAGTCRAFTVSGSGQAPVVPAPLVQPPGTPFGTGAFSDTITFCP